MARPYVSHKKLCNNSRAAMLAAIEIYNKPQTTYREQVVTVLVVNAWELILKAALRKAKKNIFYKKKRGEAYRSLSLEHCIAYMDKYRLWPETVDGDGIQANLHILTDYRNKIIHLYVADDLNSVLYMFLQQSIVNYRDLVLAIFDKDLADDITWTLLPLAARTPSDTIRSLRVDGDVKSAQVVEDFLQDLRQIIGKAESLGADMGRIAIVQEINLQSGKLLLTKARQQQSFNAKSIPMRPTRFQHGNWWSGRMRSEKTGGSSRCMISLVWLGGTDSAKT